MSGTVRDIRRRIKSVQTVGKLTRSMEMIAAIKMRKAIDKTVNLRPYTAMARQMLANVLAEGRISSPLTNKNGSNKVLVVLFTSNRGLCGGYNSRVTRLLNARYSSMDIDVVCIGKKGESYCNKVGLKVISSFNRLIEGKDYATVKELARLVTSYYADGHCGQVDIVYTNYESGFVQRPDWFRLLPLNFKSLLSVLGVNNLPAGKLVHSAEPTRRKVFKELASRIIEAQLYQALLESLASEQVGRMMAMKSSTESSRQVVSELKTDLNRTRQAGITQEIVEISVAADALINE